MASLISSIRRCSSTLARASTNSLFGQFNCSPAPLIIMSQRNYVDKKAPDVKLINIKRPSKFVVNVELNRPKQRNALNEQIWREIGETFDYLAEDPDCRVVTLTGAGPSFCSGIDFKELAQMGQMVLDENLDVSRKAVLLGRSIKQYQDWFTAIEKCPKPVIASIHGHSIGGAVDLITACDIRYATKDAIFSIKEVDIGLTADVGTLQRFPTIVPNQGIVRELAFTARDFGAEEALKIGLVTKVFDTQEQLNAAVAKLADTIAAKSPVAVQGTKIHLNYSRDHTVDEGLKFIRTWNMFGLQSEDLMKSAMAAIAREGLPEFAKL